MRDDFKFFLIKFWIFFYQISILILAAGFKCPIAEMVQNLKN